jgi:hypothetical protein
MNIPIRWDFLSLNLPFSIDLISRPILKVWVKPKNLQRIVPREEKGGKESMV